MSAFLGIFLLVFFFLRLSNSKGCFSGQVKIEKLNEVYTGSHIHQEILKIVESEKERSSQLILDNPRYLQDSHKTRFTAGIFSQLRYLTARALWNNLLHPGLYWSRIVIYLLLDLIIAAMFTRSNDIHDEHKAAMIFFVQSYLVILTVAALPYLILARPVFCRERANGLVSVLPYILSTFIAMIPGIFPLFHPHLTLLKQNVFNTKGKKLIK